MNINAENFKNYAIVALMTMMRVFPVQNNKVVFLSYYGKSYNDNPKAISDALMQHKEVDIVWGLDTPHEPVNGIRFVPTTSFRYLYELATAKVWVDNCRKRTWIRKRKKQFYIQTWHGNLGNKKIEKAAEDKFDAAYIKRAQNDARYTDLMLSGSDFFTNLCKTIFWYDGEVFECGTPRLDLFFRFTYKEREKVLQKLGLQQDAHLILYAPTFRQDLQSERYVFDYHSLLKKMEQLTGEKWILGVRLHPNVEDANSIPFDREVIDLTTYPDLYELIASSDRIISDYSSLTFEAGIIQKPVFLYVPDLEEYEKERGGYWRIEDLPFIMATTEDELIDRMIDFKQEQYLEKLNSFFSKLGIHEDGKAAEKVAGRIMDIIHDKE